jgi:DNA-binding beta-propeller fold protein YncE
MKRIFLILFTLIALWCTKNQTSAAKSISRESVGKVNTRYLMVSFLATDVEALKAHWEKNVNLDSKYTGTSEGLGGVKANAIGEEPPLGGKIAILDLYSDKIVYSWDIDAPAGFVFENDGSLTVNNMRLSYVYRLDLAKKKILSIYQHKNFNCLHSIAKGSDKTYLIASTGVDAVIEMSSDFKKEVSSWWAHEHGYNRLPNGERRNIDRVKDHSRYVYPTLWQTTHLNSVINTNDNILLVTLFHQGQLIRVNKKTGEFKVLLEGLKCPHGPIKIPHGWALPDTKNNQILLLDENFKIQKTIVGDFDWIQNIVYDPVGEKIIAIDSNKSRIVAINEFTGQNRTIATYNSSYRAYQISFLPQLIQKQLGLE